MDLTKLKKVTAEHNSESSAAAATTTTENQQQSDDNNQQQQAAPTFKDEDLLAAMSERFGQKFENLDDVKAKFEAKPASATTSADDKVKQEQQKHIEILEAFYESGGTKEQYDNIQKILATDGKELSKKEIIAEIKAEGFTDEEAADIYKNRYYIADEGEEELYTEAQRKLGEKKLTAREVRIKSQAIEPLQKAEQLLDSRKKIKDQWAGWENSVDEHFKTLSADLELPITNDEGKEIAKVTYKLSEADIKDLQSQLKNPQKVAELFYNQDTAKSARQLTQLMMWEKIGNQAASKAYNAGATETLAQVEKTFPSKPLVRPITGEVAQDANKKKAAESMTAAAQDAFTPKRFKTA